MGSIKENLVVLLDKMEFSEASQACLTASLDKILACSKTASAFQELLHRYDKTIECDYRQMIADMEPVSLEADIHPYTGWILMFLCMGPRLHQRYRERGYSDALFFRMLTDLRYKLTECKLIYNIYGTFVPNCYEGLFHMDRFAFGHLQFQLVKLGCEGIYRGLHLTPDMKAITVHIPRTGTRLYHDQVREAYREAQTFFAEEFHGIPMVFTCHSWLLYPWNLTVLSETSNLRAFISDFTLLESGDYANYNQVWRLFDCNYTGDPELLPQNSSLRRAYVQRIRDGLPTGWGQGVFMLP